MPSIGEEGPFRDVPNEMRRWLNEWRRIHQGPPQGLFHYTNAIGLQGIINSGELWATHILYLNDAQEFRFASRVIKAVFEQRVNAQTGPLRDNLGKLRDAYHSYISIQESIADPFAVCFCAEGNLLSQWRAYAANGEGFAIEFEPKMLLDKALESDPEMPEGAKLLQIVYDEQRQQDLVRRAIDSLIAAMDTNDHERVLDRAPLMFAEMSLCFKHNAFNEEKEWRLVFMRRSAPFLNVRISDGKLVPYTFFQISDRDTRPPYVSITHGPTLESRNTTNALKLLLGKALPKYWPDITVSGSDAPLRVR